MKHRRDSTPDAHDFPTRPYDLVKELVAAIAVVGVLVVALAAILSSPDEKAISLADWAKAAPNDVIATAAAELAGTSGTATYGPPYNKAGDGQQIGPLKLEKLFGVTAPIDTARDFVTGPLSTVVGDSALTTALQQWSTATADQQASWAGAYGDALAAAPDGDPAQAAAGDYGPAPVLAEKLKDFALTGGLEGALTSGTRFYTSDETRPLLLLADGSYLEDQARAQHLGGDQWGMMNETGSYPGQAWLWLYTMWYQVKPFSTSGSADALVWGLMVLLSLAMLFLPLIPGLRAIPEKLPVHRLIWRQYWRSQARTGSSP